MNTIWSIWNTLVAETPIETNANPIPSKVLADPIMQSVSIEKPSSYVGAIVGSEPETRRSSFAHCLIEIDAKDLLKESLTIGDIWTYDHCPKKVSSPPTVVTSNIVTSTVEKTNDGFRMATTSAPKKGATNSGNASKSSSMLKTTDTSSEKGKFTTSKPYSILDGESEKDVENVYD
ncbi:hypothetical protein Tco_0808091 [Tanacetum coccineum]